MSIKNMSVTAPSHFDEEEQDENVYNNTTDVEENIDNEVEKVVEDEDDEQQQRQQQLLLQKQQEKKIKKRKRDQKQNDRAVEDNEEIYGGKRQKIDVNLPLKRSNNKSDAMSISTGSVGSSAGPMRQNRVVGELVARNTLSINNESFYLFKVLIDNVSKEYYGDASQFYAMKLNKKYNLTITYEKKRYYITDFKESSEPDKKVNVKRFVCQKDFDDSEIISVLAKFQFGFKLMENDLYKMIFVVSFTNDFSSRSEGKLYQIECSATLQKISAAFKQSFDNESDLLEFFVNNQNRMINLMRIKCHQSNNNYKSFIIMDITQIERAKDAAMLKEDKNSILSVSRQNKRVIVGKITRVQAEQYGNDRLSISFNLFEQDNNDPLKGTFFCGNNNKGNNEDRLQKLVKIKMDLNQLNDMIAENITEVEFYIVADNVSKNYNIIGVTAYEHEQQQYYSI
ncbi:LEF-3 [Chrysodeixis chalcites nucleopolyhedrovirus]|uniref:LEF-3 n=1 Tax=Chrysodeixis chalcites nucleopolyhedrovirus TaxID=320432 RepID=Q4KT20_9ABAC|nr:LEF-3 [Chrysodeixis chalcites nucleopolyhedrovirus]AAY83991.1 LEF-3 [Chrysodeixis chalcites nucleopolyhedrovirus]AGE61621.1 LEF-3 [Chrysodeixis chalcites nucleopolyhedrovirus]